MVFIIINKKKKYSHDALSIHIRSIYIYKWGYNYIYMCVLRCLLWVVDALLIGSSNVTLLTRWMSGSALKFELGSVILVV